MTVSVPVVRGRTLASFPLAIRHDKESVLDDDDDAGVLDNLISRTAVLGICNSPLKAAMSVITKNPKLQNRNKDNEHNR